MNNKRSHIILPDKLMKDIDALVGTRQRGTFLTLAAEKELLRYRQIEALKTSVGAWKDKDHVELKGGSAQWVRKLRADSEHRFKRVTAVH